MLSQMGQLEATADAIEAELGVSALTIVILRVNPNF